MSYIRIYVSNSHSITFYIRIKMVQLSNFFYASHKKIVIVQYPNLMFCCKWISVLELNGNAQNPAKVEPRQCLAANRGSLQFHFSTKPKPKPFNFIMYSTSFIVYANDSVLFFFFNFSDFRRVNCFEHEAESTLHTLLFLLHGTLYGIVLDVVAKTKIMASLSIHFSSGESSLAKENNGITKKKSKKEPNIE